MSSQQDPEFDKLRRLLAIKRHERPPQDYFEGFLGEFHRRQRAEPIRRASWWEQMVEFFRGEPLLAARYALGTAVVLLLCVNAYLLTRPANSPRGPTVANVRPPTNMLSVAAKPSDFSPMPPPRTFAEPQPMLVASNNFILDRVNAVPVSLDRSGEF
jgi:hypothetical protein